VKLWIDEDLSPSLVRVGYDVGYLATSVRDRGRLSSKDHVLVPILLEEEWVLVTNNAGDFLKLVANVGLHSGLVFIELGSAAAEAQWLSAAISHIEARAADENETTEQFMVNHVVEVDDRGQCNDYPWP
jgi:predicted nuclease of predicted toxin-antitoxin system